MTTKKTVAENYSNASRKQSQSVEYGTPLDFFDKLNKIFHFEFDPCAFETNTLNMKFYWTKEQDGLNQDWLDVPTFINPPFGKNNGIVKWIRKMRYNSISNNVPYVMLLPCRLETSWFQDEIWNYGDYMDIYIIKGRLKFVNAEKNPFSYPHIVGSILWILNATSRQRRELEKSIPGIYITWDSDDA